MTCDSVQSEILNLADPRVVPGPLLEHVHACPTCLPWWQSVRNIEALVARLPVPAAPSNKKGELLEQLRGSGPILRGLPRTSSPFDRRKVYALAGLAASVAVVIGLVSLFHGPAGVKPEVVSAPPHPFLDRVVQRNIALAKSTTPADRLAVLDQYADDVRREARDLARVASADELKALAGWYDKLVKDGLVKQAEALPALDPAAKATLLRDVAGRLGTASADAERMITDVPPAAQDSMRRMSESARTGQQKLQQLAGGA